MLNQHFLHITYDKVDIGIKDNGDAVTLTFSGKDYYNSITMSINQLDILLDKADEYLDEKPLCVRLEEFWEGK